MKRNITLYYFFLIFRAALVTIPIWIVFQEKFLTFPQIAFFASLILFITVAAELPTGVLADLIGKKRTLALGALLSSLSFIVLGIYPSFNTMIIHSILLGLGGALISGADDAIIFDSLKDMNKEGQYPKLSANYSFIFQIIAMIATAAGGYLYLISDGLPYLVRGGFLMLAVPVALMMKEPFTDSETFTLRNYIKQTWIGTKEAFHNVYTAKVSWLYILIGGLSMSTQRFFVQPFLVEIEVGDVARGWTSSVTKFALALILILLTRNKRVFQSKYFALLLPVVMFLSLTFIQYTAFPAVLVLLIGINLPSGARSVFLGQIINENFRSKYRATAMSAVNMLMMGVYGLTNYFGGLYADNNSVSMLFAIIGIFSLVFLIPLTINIIQERSNRRATK